MLEVQRARQKLPPVWRHPVIDDAPRSAASAPAYVLGLAVVARERDWVRPTLVEEPVLEVVGGEAGWGEKKSIVGEVAH